ncbi:hypothetical protein Pelo_406 [Pelomyxa schiedti]|nr:hypothetical protein Pelo_406 [Pelomyxa schiedti]
MTPGSRVSSSVMSTATRLFVSIARSGSRPYVYIMTRWTAALLGIFYECNKLTLWDVTLDSAIDDGESVSEMQKQAR